MNVLMKSMRKNRPAGHRSPAGKILRLLNSKDDANICKRNLMFLTIAQFVAMIGMSGCIPFLPLFVMKLGVTDVNQARFWSGLLFGGPYFLAVLAVPLWGILGDKHGRKIMVVRALLGLAVAVTLMGFSRSAAQLLTLRVLQGAVSGFIAASLAFVTANTPSERTGYAISILSGATSAGNIIGPLFGGLVSDIVGIRPVFFIVGGICLVTGIFVLIYVKESTNSISPASEESVIDNMKFAWKNRTIMMILLLVVISQVGINFSSPIFPFFVESLGAPESAISTITGLLIASVGIFSIILAPYWGRRNDRMDHMRTLSLASCACGLSFMAHIFAPNFYWLFPLRIVTGVFVAAIVPTLYSAMSKKTAREKQGGIMGLASSATMLGALVAFLSCGAVASTVGMNACFIISGMCLIVVAAAAHYGRSEMQASTEVL